MRRFVGISCCLKSFGPNTLPNHAASDACVRAVAEVADAVPVLLPALGDIADIQALLGRLDGILLTGSRSMVCPARYGGRPHAEDVPEDAARDATTLPLIRAAIANGLPLLAICRGLQELNVALGGTLHQRLEDLPGRIDHSAPKVDDLAVKFAKAHTVRFTPGGMLRNLAGAPDAMVNSLHHQGIDRLAPPLVVEAVAEDGTIEAVRHPESRGLTLGVQWHPEADWRDDLLSRELFAAFGAAMKRASMPDMAMAAD